MAKLPAGRTILVTGGAGYLGSALVGRLLEAGQRVCVLDRLDFGDGPLAGFARNPAFRLIRDSLAAHEAHPALLDDVWAVVHLAGLANDQSCDLDPDDCVGSGNLVPLAFARRARAAGVSRFVLASSCSVYGASADRRVDESTPPSPASLYAISKLRLEETLLPLGTPGFVVTGLRFATLYGVAPRMRFDLVLNTMVKTAVKTGEIRITGDGSQHRPLLDVRDAAASIVAVLAGSSDDVGGQIFNCGSDEQTCTIRELATLVTRELPGVSLHFLPDQADPRSYRVAFDKIRSRLGFQPKHTLQGAVSELRQALTDGTFPEPDADRFHNVRTLAHGRSERRASRRDGKTLPGRVVAMVLAHDCAPMLPRAIARIPRYLVDDLFVMDDGSTDGTADVARRLGVAVHRSESNRGYGGNVKAGLRQALARGADFVVEVHGDGAQFDPGSILYAMPAMRRGADLVLGSRFREPGRARENGMPWLRFAANRALSACDRLVLGLPLTEFHTGFRIYSRRLIETLPIDAATDDYLFSFEVIAQAAYFGLSVEEVPVEADYHAAHTSHALPGAAAYAVRTFRVLSDYLLASRRMRFTGVFPRLPSDGGAPA